MITTKFKIGDRVWFLWGGIKADLIKAIRVTTDIDPIDGETTKTTYWMHKDENFTGRDDNLFLNKEELIKHLSNDSTTD